jgi:hypothetical protein
MSPFLVFEINKNFQLTPPISDNQRNNYLRIRPALSINTGKPRDLLRRAHFTFTTNCSSMEVLFLASFVGKMEIRYSVFVA